MLIKKKISHQFSAWNRRRKLEFVFRFIDDHKIKSCLLVGAKPDATGVGFNNLIERGILGKISKVVATGLEPEGNGWPEWLQCDGRDLPFAANSFDLVFSNAVIEHVGLINDQIKFIIEHDRVGKSWIFTTPNRLFPVESHTQTLFFHMSPKWKNPIVSRLLSKQDLLEILPQGSQVIGHIFSPTFICYKIQEQGRVA